MGRRTLVLVIAVALAVISGYAVWQYLSSVGDDAAAEYSEVEVYRATEDIASGTLGEDAAVMIETSSALRNQVVFEDSTILCTGAVGGNATEDPNIYGCTQNPSDLNVVLDGKLAAGPIAAGQLITTGSFALGAELQQSLSDSIAPGKVAISISVDATTASGGYIRPGDNVNILASASLSPLSFIEIISNEELRDLLVEAGAEPEQADDATGAPVETADETGPTNLASAIPTSFDVTQTILQNVQVLAVGDDTRPAPLETGLTPLAGVVTFEVTPQEAEQIEWARQYSSLALSLLPKNGDYVPYDAQPVVVDDIFGLLDRIQVELGLVSSGDGN
jgi:Flp pilus assembly protein CpaB